MSNEASPVCFPPRDSIMSKPKILCVDDEDLCRDFFTKFLPDDEYDIHVASNGQEALRIVNDFSPDLIFLDLRMPVLDGLGFLKKNNQKSLSNCPVIAITGYDDELMLQQCYEQGIVSLIRKPLREAEVTAMTRRYTKLVEIKHDLKHQMDGLDSLLNGKDDISNTQNEEQHNLFEAMPIPVFYKDSELIFRKINKAFEEFAGLSRQEIIGKTLHEIAINIQADHSTQLEKDILLTGESKSYEGQVVNAVGQRREIIWHKAAVKDRNLNIIGLLGVMIDLSGYGLSSFSTYLTSRNSAITPRECQVANWVRIGISNKEISNQMKVSLSTVEFHRHNLREKLGLKGRKVNLRTFLLSIGDK